MIETLEGRRLFAGLTVNGTAGDDQILVRIHADTMQFVTLTVNGDVSYHTSVTSVTVSGGTGNDVIFVGSEISVACVLSGNSGHDTITGGRGADHITGNNGNDLIYAGGGNDIVVGNDGGDSLYGEDGNDILYGGLGSDYLYGGTKWSDDDTIYQNDTSNTEDGSYDELWGTDASNFIKTRADRAFNY
ncbi:MAG TPA: hypothetical protein VF595_10270 [Tepidisphaeraceae bacterium]|jgi:Ca2+-binding RTX toxin-like protein